MTVVVDNASMTFVQALKEMAKLDGASVFVDKNGTYYKDRVVHSILHSEKKMQKAREKGKLQFYNSVDELFEDCQ